MGYIRNHTIVVSSWLADAINAAHISALQCFAQVGMGDLVSPIIPHSVNAGAAFFIAPDGSKEGWPESAKGDEARSAFKDWLRNSQHYVDWAEIMLGGDDCEYKVLNAPNRETPA